MVDGILLHNSHTAVSVVSMDSPTPSHPHLRSLFFSYKRTEIDIKISNQIIVNIIETESVGILLPLSSVSPAGEASPETSPKTAPRINKTRMGFMFVANCDG
jgi:hypothetical protein